MFSKQLNEENYPGTRIRSVFTSKITLDSRPFWMIPKFVLRSSEVWTQVPQLQAIMNYGMRRPVVGCFMQALT
jgi:hypothetical protein